LRRSCREHQHQRHGGEYHAHCCAAPVSCGLPSVGVGDGVPFSFLFGAVYIGCIKETPATSQL
jgi:hypothetical protein